MFNTLIKTVELIVDSQELKDLKHVIKKDCTLEENIILTDDKGMFWVFDKNQICYDQEYGYLRGDCVIVKYKYEKPIHHNGVYAEGLTECFAFVNEFAFGVLLEMILDLKSPKF